MQDSPLVTSDGTSSTNTNRGLESVCRVFFQSVPLVDATVELTTVVFYIYTSTYPALPRSLPIVELRNQSWAKVWQQGTAQYYVRIMSANADNSVLFME